MKEKEKLKISLIPLAVLLAKTHQAKTAIIDHCKRRDIIPIWEYPCRFGRESRYEMGSMGVSIIKRLMFQPEPNNDVYLLDAEEYLHISREHFLIDKIGTQYYLQDRNSTAGTTLNGKTIHDSSVELKDGDIIQIGGEVSPYMFEFVVLEDVSVEC